MIKKNIDYESSKIAEFEERSALIKDKSLDIWILLQLCDESYEGHIFLKEIETISQYEFTILKNVASIVELVRGKLNSANTIVSSSGTLFAVELKPHAGCLSSVQLSPLKSSVLAEVRSDYDNSQGLAVNYSMVMGVFKSSLLEMVASLAEQVASESNQLLQYLDELPKEGEITERVRALQDKYNQLQFFSEKSQSVRIPFPIEKIVEKLSLIYADMEKLNLSIKQNKGGSFNTHFFEKFFRPLLYLFYPIFKAHSEDLYTLWKNTSVEFMLIDFRYRSRLSGGDVIEIKEYLSEENIDDVSESLYHIYQDLVAILDSAQMSSTAMKQLAMIVQDLSKIYCYHKVISDLDIKCNQNVFPEDQCAEPDRKIQKKMTFSQTENMRDYVEFLSDFCHALLVYIDRSSIQFHGDLVPESEDFFEKHDSDFLKAQRIVSCMNNLIGSLSQYQAVIQSRSADDKACYQGILQHLNQFKLSSLNRLNKLASSRQNFHQLLLKSYHDFTHSYHGDLDKGLSEFRKLINPTWLEYDEKDLRLGCYLDALKSVQRYFHFLGQLLVSIKLTQGDSSFVEGYTQATQKLITTLQDAYDGLATAPDFIVGELLRGIRVWFEKVQLACSSTVENLNDLKDRFYLFALYHHHNMTIIRQLSLAEEFIQKAELTSLKNTITAFSTNNCKNAVLKLRDTQPLKELASRLANQIETIKSSRSKLPSLFHFLVRHLLLSEQKARKQLLQDCTSANNAISDIVGFNQELMKELIPLSDFFAALPPESAMVKVANAFRLIKESVAEYQEVTATLCYLIDQPQSPSETVCQQSYSTLTQYMRDALLMLSQSTTIYKSVMQAIAENDDSEITERSEEWRTQLQYKCDQLQVKSLALKASISSEGALIQPLSQCQQELRNVAYAVIPMAATHLDNLVQKMHELSEKLPVNRSFSPK